MDAIGHDLPLYQNNNHGSNSNGWRNGHEVALFMQCKLVRGLQDYQTLARQTTSEVLPSSHPPVQHTGWALKRRPGTSEAQRWFWEGANSPCMRSAVPRLPMS